MKKNEIKLGGLYLAKVGGAITTVRVDLIRTTQKAGFRRSIDSTDATTVTLYDVTNLRTGRRTTFRSAAKFRAEVTPKPMPGEGKEDFVDRSVSSETRQMRDAAKTENEMRTDPLGKILSDALREESTIERTDDQVGHVGEPDCPKWVEPSEEADPMGRAPSEQPTGGGESEEGEQGSDPTPASATQQAASPPTGGTVQSTATSIPGLATKIAAVRQTRQPGTPVAGMVPNEEQEEILATAERIYHRTSGLRVLVIGAGAGTGKTATDKMLEEVLPGRGQYTAFNTSLCADAKGKFKKCAVNTTHSLAFRAVGKQYQHRLGGERMRSGQVARLLGIEPLTITLKGQGEPVTDEQGNTRNLDKLKTLQADFLAGQVLTAVKRFCQSADREIGAEHLRYIDGIDVATEDGNRSRENNDKVRDYLLPLCRKAWADLSHIDGQLPFAHDVYVKLWQLGTGNDRPTIAADYILLDEAQDTAPVFLDVLKQQTHALLVFVGDSNQAIYEWRGAVDAMKAYPDAERRLLSQSYRFGQAVADVANAVLATLEEPTDLRMRGMPGLPTRVAEVTKPRCYLYRTNAGAVGRVMNAIECGKKPHLIGGGADVVAWCQAAVDLQAKRGTRHPELCCFADWNEVVEYSKTDEGSDLKLMVKLVTDFGAERIRDALKNMPEEEQADLVISTAHKSKGREWDSVKLGQDFPTANKMGDPDRRLLYVAATRAKLVLDISECPPFCGGYEKSGPRVDDDGEEGYREDCQQGEGWVPGIRITYTQPMPTEADLAAYVAGNGSSRPAAGQTLPSPLPAPSPPADAPAAVPIAANGNGRATATYGKLRDGSWGIRSTTAISTGQTITVEKRSGERKTEVVGRIVWQGNGVWLATIQ